MDKLMKRIEKIKSIKNEIKKVENEIILAEIIKLYEGDIMKGIPYKTLIQIIREDLNISVNYVRFKREISIYFKAKEMDIIRNNQYDPDELGNVCAWYKTFIIVGSSWNGIYKPIFNVYYGSVESMPKKARTFSKDEYEIAKQFDKRMMKAFSEYNHSFDFIVDNI